MKTVSFFIILIAASELKNVDLSKIDEYEILLSEHDDGYHIIGELVDGEGNVLGRL